MIGTGAERVSRERLLTGSSQVWVVKEDIAEEGKYRRSLGMVELVSLGVGVTVGSGIFIVPGVAAKLSGPYSL